jgi:hypothetical protein
LPQDAAVGRVRVRQACMARARAQDLRDPKAAARARGGSATPATVMSAKLLRFVTRGRRGSRTMRARPGPKTEGAQSALGRRRTRRESFSRSTPVDERSGCMNTLRAFARPRRVGLSYRGRDGTDGPASRGCGGASDPLCHTLRAARGQGEPVREVVGSSSKYPAPPHLRAQARSSRTTEGLLGMSEVASMGPRASCPRSSVLWPSSDLHRRVVSLSTRRLLREVGTRAATFRRQVARRARRRASRGRGARLGRRELG